MRTFPILAAIALALGTSIATARAQEKGTPAEPDPAVEDKLDVLEDAVGDRKMSRDAEAVALLGELGGRYAELHPSDQKKVLRAVGQVLTRGRLRPPERLEVYRAAAEALAGTGDDGARVMHRAFETKRFPKKTEWAPARALLVRNIGRTRDPAMVKFLCERAGRDGEDEVLVATGEALANYADFDQKVRKEIAKAMIKRFGAVEANASAAVLRADQPQNLAQLNAQKTLDAIAETWNGTLTKLTTQSFKTANDWQRWYNKAKTENWDEDR